eukprot:1143400-Pelagomonas_calceolata.AAC.2
MQASTCGCDKYDGIRGLGKLPRDASAVFFFSFTAVKILTQLQRYTLSRSHALEPDTLGLDCSQGPCAPRMLHFEFVRMNSCGEGHLGLYSSPFSNVRPEISAGPPDPTSVSQKAVSSRENTSDVGKGDQWCCSL